MWVTMPSASRELGRLTRAVVTKSALFHSPCTVELRRPLDDFTELFGSSHRKVRIPHRSSRNQDRISLAFLENHLCLFGVGDQADRTSGDLCSLAHSLSKLHLIARPDISFGQFDWCNST